MLIQWYPGHMHKAKKALKDILSRIDIFIEVLDARIPFSSANPMLATICGSKPCIKVLNKSDLADSDITKEWHYFLEHERNVKSISLTTEDPNRTFCILELCNKILLRRSQSIKNIQALIMGIPNSGKSTLINILAKRDIACTGDEPAVTKVQQRIKLKQGIVLIDTPGMLWPNLRNINIGYRLAITGAIRETAFDNIEIACYAISYFRQRYPKLIKKRYNLARLIGDELEILEDIGVKRGCFRVGGKVDFERISKILITDFRSMMLGSITLETPGMIKNELAECLNIKAR
ncbi:MAG: ribosome biogenesis GTPase YlqF [Piscirickettsiaceae bacterium]|nr:ribosome biogenesis GTPase YlqF [Piscirickettsiaceae bacterium]